MKSVTSFLLFISLSFVSLVLMETGVATADKDGGVYIVYMGASVPANVSKNEYHNQLLRSVLNRRKDALVYRYRHGISGFAARLSAAEAQSIAQQPGVVSVFPDPVYRLHTTRSWDFLKYESDMEIDSSSPTLDPSSSTSRGADTIIGIIDSGIWPESESFNDKDIGPIPSHWKGTCMEGFYFNSSNCNRKLIGARFYKAPDSDYSKDYNTPRDMIGHGTHVAATAAGSPVPGASYYGLAEGTAKGGSPGSRIAVYRVCTPSGCLGSSILKAFDDAIADGVDVISASLGTPHPLEPELKKDPIAIGAFHAVENGITVVCSAGNDGPTTGTVVNIAPWILTVGATTIDRDFETDIVLGGNKVIKGEGIHFSNLQSSPVHPLINGSNCYPGYLNKDKVRGKIVHCLSVDSLFSPQEKIAQVKRKGGVGLILADDLARAVPEMSEDFPMAVVSVKDAVKIIAYVNSTDNPVGTILPTVVHTQYKPAPQVAHFSGRGPASMARNILKPDIVAPGVAILAAWLGNDRTLAPEGKQPPLFNIVSGTSMSCPHASGVAATVKSQHPTWSPSAIKSAIMTTASQTNNMMAPLTEDSGYRGIPIPYDYGAGEITTSEPLQPGLVYETTTIDYLNFLCYYGYDASTIKAIAKTVPDGFSCPKHSSADLISQINYPSIAVINFDGNRSIIVTRTVTNVAADGPTTYSLIVDFPPSLLVAVGPDLLHFTKTGEKQSYRVLFAANGNPLDRDEDGAVTDMFGAITWTNGKYKVRIPFVVGNTCTYCTY